MIVLDASCIIDFTLNAEAFPDLQNLIAQNHVIAAPHLLSYEVLNVIRRHTLANACTVERAREAIALFRNLNIKFYEPEIFLDRIWQLRHNLTAYDAAYVSLAEVLEVPFYTGDLRIVKSIGHTAKIFPITPAPKSSHNS
jgi:predicted nucleic acid-binding protein